MSYIAIVRWIWKYMTRCITQGTLSIRSTALLSPFFSPLPPFILWLLRSGARCCCCSNFGVLARNSPKSSPKSKALSSSLSPLELAVSWVVALPGDENRGSIKDFPFKPAWSFIFCTVFVVVVFFLFAFSKEESSCPPGEPFPDPMTSLKSATARLQTAHSMSFSPTILRALVKHVEHKGWRQGCKMARVEG